MVEHKALSKSKCLLGQFFSFKIEMEENLKLRDLKRGEVFGVSNKQRYRDSKSLVSTDETNSIGA